MDFQPIHPRGARQSSFGRANSHGGNDFLLPEVAGVPGQGGGGSAHLFYHPQYSIILGYFQHFPTEINFEGEGGGEC
jgi:hypothetical protein